MSTLTTVVSSGELETKTGPELVEIYNSLGPEKKVKRFSTHAAGVRRVLSLLADQQGGELARSTAKRQGRSVAVPKTKKRKPYELPLLGRIKPHREGTKRAQAIDLLKGGCTFEVMRDAVGWNDRQAHEAIRILHHYLGYGVTEKSGIIRLVWERRP